jgi:hypothetical protein
MAKKKVTIETLTAQIENSFAAVATDMDDIRDHVATKRRPREPQSRVDTDFTELEDVVSPATASLPSSRGSSELQLHLSNSLVGRCPIVCLELQSEVGLGFAHEHRSLAQCACGFRTAARESLRGSSLPQAPEQSRSTQFFPRVDLGCSR